MNYIYTKLMSWAVGEALANSDRVRVMALALAGIIFTRILAACPQCSTILTPDVVQALTVALGGAAVTLVAALSHRDVAAPGQSVPGAAPTVAPLPIIPTSAPAAKVGAFLLVGLLGLGALALPSHAQALSLGPISLSPTAGPLQVTVEPLVSLTSFRAGAGVVLTAATDILGGMEVMANWGPYHVGLGGAFDRDTFNNVNYGAAGILVGVRHYGDVAVMWRNAGALVGYAIPIGVGVTP